MTKIEFDDPELNEEESFKKKDRKKVGRLFFGILMVIAVFIAGAVGGVGGVILLSADNASIANKLGLKNLTIPTTKTEKLTLEESSAIIDTTNKVSASVVSITTKTTVQNIFGQSVQAEAAGTGFIITSDGLILTNKHVAPDTTTTYTVVTLDGTSYDAKVQSVDPVNDLAVLKIDARNLPVVDLGDSDQLQVGQWVIAVGNALGQFQNTVTAGIISAKDRKIDATDAAGGSAETLSGMIQTDAAINSGNSGGPLVNMAGQVIGINTAVAAGANGIGFAIPINVAKSAIDSIKKTGRIIRPYLGVRYLEITKSLAAASKLPSDHGALIQRGSGLTDFAVVPSSPADKAGLVENDIILSVNGDNIDETHSLMSLIQQYQVGDTITLHVLSKGSEKDVKVKLEESK